MIVGFLLTASCIHDPDRYTSSIDEVEELDVGSSEEVGGGEDAGSQDSGSLEDSGAQEDVGDGDSGTSDASLDADLDANLDAELDTGVDADLDTSDPGPDADPGPELYDCEDFEVPVHDQLSISFEPGLGTIFSGEPFSMVVVPNLSDLGQDPVFLGIELVDRVTGECATHSESACTPTAADRHILTHGEAPPVGHYCVFLTTRPDGEKRYHAIYEMTVEERAEGQTGYTCEQVISEPGCFGTPCLVENDGACDAGLD